MMNYSNNENGWFKGESRIKNHRSAEEVDKAVRGQKEKCAAGKILYLRGSIHDKRSIFFNFILEKRK